MTDPVFVRVRNDEGEIYGSYLAYWELVELSGFDTCELGELSRGGERRSYILAPNNGNVRDACNAHRKSFPLDRLILWQLEIPGQVEPKVPDYVNEMWVSDREYHRMVGDKRCKYVPIGGHPDFGWDASGDEKKYDIVHMSYLYGKRAEQVAALEARGYTIAPVGFDKARDEAISASRYGLCLHQHDVPILEPLRHTMFSLFKVPLIIEYCTDPFPYQGQPYRDFLETGPRQDVLEASAEYNFNLLTKEMTFRKCVESVL